MVTNAQPAKNFLALALEFPGFGLIHAIADLAELTQQRRVIGVLLQLLDQPFVALNQLHLFAAVSEHLLKNRALRIKAGVLVDINHPVPRIDLNPAVADGF